MEILLEAGNRAGKVEASGISNLSLLKFINSLNRWYIYKIYNDLKRNCTDLFLDFFGENCSLECMAPSIFCRLDIIYVTSRFF